MQLSDRCRLDASKLRERLEHERQHPTPAPVPKRRAASLEPPPRDEEGYEPSDHGPYDDDGLNSANGSAGAQRSGPGLEALKLAVHHPEKVGDRLQAVLFVDQLQRDSFTALVEHDSLHEAISSAPPPVAALLRRVTVEEPRLGDIDLGDPIDSVVNVLLREAVRRALAELTVQSRGLEASWQSGAAETVQVRLWLDELDDPTAGRGAAERLVAWLTERERTGQ
jgi:hypothetical protein